MEATNDLFQLIKSMTQHEKSYFKRMSSGGYSTRDKVGYIKLFDVIDKMQEYDEHKIRKTFKGNRMLKQLAKAKHYLYNTILQNLRLYYSNTTVQKKLRAMLDYVEILYKRGLYEQCMKLLYNAKSLALEHELFLFVFEIHRWVLNIFTVRVNVAGLEQCIDRFYEEEVELWEKMKQSNQCRNVSLKITVHIKKEGYARTAEEQERFSQIISHIANIEDVALLTDKAKQYYLHSYTIYYIATGDFVSAYKHIKDYIVLLESDRKRIIEYIHGYIGALGNLLDVLMPLQRYDEYREVIQKMRSIPDLLPKSQRFAGYVRIFALSHLFEIDLELQTGNFEKAVKICPVIKKGIREFGDKITKEYLFTLYFNMAYAYFGANDYNKALLCLNMLFSEPSLSLKQDVQSFARILQLIIYWEKEDIDVLADKLRSVYRFLDKKGRLYKVEEVLLRFIKEGVSKKVMKQQRFGLLQEMYSELKEVIKDPYEKKALSHFDFISWMDSKIEGKMFAEVVRGKAKKT